MDRRVTLTVTVLVATVLTRVSCSSFGWKRVWSAQFHDDPLIGLDVFELTAGVNSQVSGFSWKNCGQLDDPAVLKTLTVSPDPISIPGDLTASASGSTSVELSAPLALNVTLEKEVAGFWVKVPCLEEVGSCHYQDACDILNQLIPPGQDCPEPLHTYGLPCRCPFKAGSYSLPQSDFYLPNVDLPYWLTNGNYRVQGVLGSQGKELGCLELTLAIHSD